jgi:fucose permease
VPLWTLRDTDAVQPVHPLPGRVEQMSTRVAFFVTGVAMASWAPLVPFAKARLALDEGRLGLLLLCMGLGSVVAMPFSGGLSARFGCRKTILTAGILACLMIPFLATVPSAALLAPALLVFGGSLGIIDVVMNVQAVVVEKASGRPMMSGFHGFFSVGGLAGAGLMTGLMAVGASPLVATVVTGGLAILLLASFWKGLLPYAPEGEGAAFAIPRGFILLLGVLCFGLFMAEGSVLDWSGVLLRVTRGLDARWAGIGYIAFATTMTVGRLTGDFVVKALGPTRVLLFGSLCSAAGFALAALGPSWVFSVVGFGLVGIGAANLVPVVISAAGRQKVIALNHAIAAVTTLGYAGILLGPALIGFIARATSLPIALLFISGMLVLVALTSGKATGSEV